MQTVLVLLAFCLSKACSFAPRSSAPQRSPLFVADQSAAATESPLTSTLRVPLTLEEMVRQVSSAVKQAAESGKKRQIVRVLLPRDAASGNFGTYVEGNALENSKLVPNDESWQGGIMQIYRAAAPTASLLLRQLTANDSGVPPRVTEDRSVDESGVDGVGLIAADDGTVSCWVQPTQEAVEDIILDRVGNELCILLNPQWRLVDDALDAASQSGGFLGNLASFLGGKGSTLKQLADAGFAPVYTLEGYVCRGSNVRLLQVLDSDWAVFCERDDNASFLSIGSCKTRPTYQQVEELLDQSNIGYKYARDIGIAPKL